jgi:carboxypeptidase family protein
MVTLVPSRHLLKPWRTISELCLSGTLIFARPQQRIPRQTAPTTSAIQGIIRNQTRLGLGGVSVILHNFSTGENLQATTTGAGAFRFLNLHPGPYELKAELDRFAPFDRSDIQLRAGEVFPVEITFQAIPQTPPPAKPPAESGPPIGC